MIALFFLGNTLQAQVPVFTLDSAVARVLKNYPSITAAQLEVQQQEALRKTAFQLDPLNAHLQGGQINSGVNDFDLQITTGIPGAHGRGSWKYPATTRHLRSHGKTSGS